MKIVYTLYGKMTGFVAKNEKSAHETSRLLYKIILSILFLVKFWKFSICNITELAAIISNIVPRLLCGTILKIWYIHSKYHSGSIIGGVMTKFAYLKFSGCVRIIGCIQIQKSKTSQKIQNSQIVQQICVIKSTFLNVIC